MKISQHGFGMVRFASLTVVLVLAGCSSTDEPKQASAPAGAYPLTVCVVSGEKLGGDMGKPVIMTHEGREVQLCCSSCEEAFKKDPQKYIAMVDAAMKTGKAPATQPEHAH